MPLNDELLYVYELWQAYATVELKLRGGGVTQGSTVAKKTCLSVCDFGLSLPWFEQQTILTLITSPFLAIQMRYKTQLET